MEIGEKMDNLKPCPFCGCKNIDVIKISYIGEVYLTCPECDIEQPVYSTLNEAIEAWNRRAEMPSVQSEIIRCRECKWWSNDEYRECSNPNYPDGYVTPAGFYCAWAERRADEQIW